MLYSDTLYVYEVRKLQKYINTTNRHDDKPYTPNNKSSCALPCWPFMPKHHIVGCAYLTRVNYEILLAHNVVTYPVI